MTVNGEDPKGANPHRGRPIEDLGLPDAVAAALRAATVRTVGGLTLYSPEELLALCPVLGADTLARIEVALVPLGLHLAGRGPVRPQPEPEQPKVTLPAGQVDIITVAHTKPLPISPSSRGPARKSRGKRRREPEVVSGPLSVPGFGGAAIAVNNGTRRQALLKSMPPGTDFLADQMMGRYKELWEVTTKLRDAEHRCGVLESEKLVAAAALVELEGRLAAAVAERAEALPVPSTAREAAPAPVDTGGEVADLGLLLERAEAERDAAVRGKDAVRAFYAERLRRAGVSDAREARLRDLLDADTMCGVLDQAEVVCTMLRFTLDRDAAEKLDRHKTAGPVRARLADALATMQEYAVAKSAALAHGRAVGLSLSNLRAYCADSGSGALISANHVVLREGGQVTQNPRLRESRTLPLPPEVSGGPRVFMAAHIKIGLGFPPAPRLYFWDDTVASGLVVVGRVGGHLPNAADG